MAIDARLEIRITKEEKRVASELAKAANKTLADYIRWLIAREKDRAKFTVSPKP